MYKSDKLVKIKPSDIFISERARSELGDIEDMAQSLKEFGLMTPITIDSNGHLKDGGRRLTAWKKVFGDEPIDAYIYNRKENSIITELRMEKFSKKFTHEEKYKAGIILEKKFKKLVKTKKELYSLVGKELGLKHSQYYDLKRVFGIGKDKRFSKYEGEKVRKTARKKGITAALNLIIEINRNHDGIKFERIEYKQPDINEVAFDMYTKVTEINSVLINIIPHLEDVNPEVLKDLSDSLYKMWKILSDGKSETKLLEVRNENSSNDS